MMAIASLTSTATLFLASVGHWQYGMLGPLRWTVSGCALLIAMGAFNQKALDWMGIMFAIMFLFNPLVPIDFSLETVVMVDLAAGATCMAAGIELSRSA